MTLVVNLFGPPGSGKSTTRAGVFYELKMAGVNCEEVTEFAKDLTHEGRTMALGCQDYVHGKQLRNMQRVLSQYAVIITDSPTLFSSYYARKYQPLAYPPSFYSYVASRFRHLGDAQLNYTLTRPPERPYNPVGRNQSETEANAMGHEMIDFLVHEGVTFEALYSGRKTVEYICETVLRHTRS